MKLLKQIILIIFLPVFITLGCNNKKESDTKKPNIIFIMADDLGYGDLGSYGQKVIKTPNLDKLAEQGTRFTQFYAAQTVCAPSRFALMTGKNMGNAYLRGNTFTPIRSTDLTIAEVLQNAGYKTGMFGKWGLGDAGTVGDPIKKGFDAFTGYTNQVEAHRYYGNTIDKIIDGKTVKVDNTLNEYTYDIAIRDAMSFIKENKDNNFFAYLPIRLPHVELLAPEKDMQLYLDKDGQSIFDETPFLGDGHHSAQKFPNATYAAMVSKIDSDIGNIVELLKELNIDDNTIIFFTSDNGADGELGHTIEYFMSNGELRGGKRDLYEGGIRVPMIVWGPKNITPQRVSNDKWTLWDVFPTITDLVGEQKPNNIDGISMANLVLDKENVAQHDHLYWEYGISWLKQYTQAVIKGEWKLIKTNRNIESVTYELYNLDDDISESNDLSENHPQKVIELNELIINAHTKPELPEFDYSYLPDASIIPPYLLSCEEGKSGLLGEYFEGVSFNKLIKKQIDSIIRFQWGHEAKNGLPKDNFSIRWTGQLKAEQTGEYHFYTGNDDGVRVWVNNELIIDDWNTHGVEINSGTISLKKNNLYNIKIEYFEGTGGAEMKLGWIVPQK